MSLIVETRHKLGPLTLEAAFTSEGGITALFGRSGSGKTSLVNIIAGLLRPLEGRIVINGDVICDSARGIFTPPHKRRFGYVFQEARLFPHMSVRRNLTYGRWFAGRDVSGRDKGRDKDGQGFDRIVDLLGVRPLLARAPANLSGGEKQRIAIGRALLSNPRLLLMDEPLAALDDERKAEILPYLERLRDEMEIPIVYVSHSVAEVARLANRVIVLENGRVRASGDAAAVLSQPLPATVSRRETGVVIEGLVEAADDLRITRIRVGALSISVPHLSVATGRTVRIRIAAQDVMLATVEPRGISALNILEGTIQHIGEVAQDRVDIRIDCSGTTIVSRITAVSRDALALRSGMTIFAIIKSMALDP